MRRFIYLLALFVIFSGSFSFNSKAATAAAKEQNWAAEKYSDPDQLLLEPGEIKSIRLGFLNKGRYNWRRFGANFVSLYTINPKYHASRFYDTSWLSPAQPAKLKNPLVAPNRLGYLEFKLKAPQKTGIYKETLALAAENRTWIPGGKVELTITVTENQEPAAVEENADNNEEPEDFEIGQQEAIISEVPPFGSRESELALRSLGEGGEPRFRVGLYTTEKPVIFSSPFNYELRDINFNLLGIVEPEQKVELTYNPEKKIYQASWAGEIISSESVLRLEPQTNFYLDQGPAYFFLQDFSNHLRWDKKQNDNKFKDTLELRFSEKTKFLWAINELALEEYLKGLIETPEHSPAEFKKAVLIAARTYAYYHLTHPTKHAANGFILDADYDQVYRGYGAELRSPGNTEAVEATRGLVVTYQDEVVPTPYFARSDGRTRSFKEVWGKSLPWLVSVQTPYDRGWRKFGHGVGMSQRDARIRAQKGAYFEQILKYYYKGIEIKPMYSF